MTGIEIIAEERASHFQRGYDADHDAEHVHCELALAAACYACEDTVGFVDDGYGNRLHASIADRTHRRGKNRIRQLAIAGALIAAEIDRLKYQIEKEREKRFASEQNP